MDKIKIGKRLRNLRGETPMIKVANDIGVSVSALSMYENGDRIPRDEIKLKLAKYYCRTVDEIFFAA